MWCVHMQVPVLVVNDNILEKGSYKPVICLVA